MRTTLLRAICACLLLAGGPQALATQASPAFYTGLGEKERAIDLLEQAVSLGWGDRAWMENDSDLEPLRDEPRFQALLVRIH
ncbi:MAG: hypothetical protein EOP93_05710 [Lysobacteraceae bacterium]|nr:MAG: hypothetical protein EOP93_05710 [Xanthomonadaceae bacterium]